MTTELFDEVYVAAVYLDAQRPDLFIGDMNVRSTEETTLRLHALYEAAFDTGTTQNKKAEVTASRWDRIFSNQPIDAVLGFEHPDLSDHAAVSCMLRLQ